jgi:hypothetical protein
MRKLACQAQIRADCQKILTAFRGPAEARLAQTADLVKLDKSNRLLTCLKPSHTIDSERVCRCSRARTPQTGKRIRTKFAGAFEGVSNRCRTRARTSSHASRAAVLGEEPYKIFLASATSCYRRSRATRRVRSVGATFRTPRRAAAASRRDARAPTARDDRRAPDTQGRMPPTACCTC